MNNQVLETLINTTSSINLNFDIFILSHSLNVPLKKLIDFFEKGKGTKLFEKLSDTRFKYKDTKLKTKILSNINHDNKINFKNKYKKSLIENIQILFRDLYINEVEKFNKDRILSFFLYFTQYVLSLDYYNIAEQNINFILQRIHPKIEDYEKALYTKAHINYLNKKYVKSIEILNKIKYYPEQVTKKFELLTTIYSILGDHENFFSEL